MMNDEIRQRLVAVYSSGILSEPDKAQYRHERANTLWQQFSNESSGLGGRCERLGVSWGRKVSSINITDLNGPNYINWLSMGNPQKIKWLSNHDGVFPAMWLDVSNVWPAFEIRFGLWRPRGDTGYVDCISSQTSERGPWPFIEVAARQAAIAAGFVALTQDEEREMVLFVMEQEWSDLPDKDEPTLKITNVSQCLFQDY